MDKYIVKNGKELRLGYTTGSCAAAASKAAAIMLLTGTLVKSVDITLPMGEQLTLSIHDTDIQANSASCAVIKDGGDDPDSTNGMKIYSRVSLVSDTDKTLVDGGIGIGRVTKPGLPCPVGEAAINPEPRKMIQTSLVEAAKENRYNGGFQVLISAPEGQEIAKKTFNPRLGIVGGISILGTTGIVEPMSEAAIIDTIKLEINSKPKDDILFLSPGNYGLEFSKQALGLDIERAVKCSNFIGEALDFANYCGFERILLIGHIGKLVKLAAGIMNTHSKVADGRKEVFAAHAGVNGADKTVLTEIMNAATTDEIHRILKGAFLYERVYESISERIAFELNYRLKGNAQIEFVVFSNENGVLMKSEQANRFIDWIRSTNDER